MSAPFHLHTAQSTFCLVYSCPYESLWDGLIFRQTRRSRRYHRWYALNILDPLLLLRAHGRKLSCPTIVSSTHAHIWRPLAALLLSVLSARVSNVSHESAGATTAIPVGFQGTNDMTVGLELSLCATDLAGLGCRETYVVFWLIIQRGKEWLALKTNLSPATVVRSKE